MLARSHRWSALLMGLLLLLTADPLSPSQTAERPRLSDSLAGLPPGLAEATFDSVWTRVRDTHYDPAMGGLDWDAVYEELRPLAVGASSNADLREVLTEMLDRLGESHFALIPGAATPGFTRSTRPSPTGEGDPGLDVRWIDGALLVTRVREHGPAAKAGIRPGWILEEIDGLPTDTLATWILDAAPPGREARDLATWLPVSARYRLLGPEGTPVVLTLEDGSHRALRVSVPRAAPQGDRVEFGHLPPLRVEVEQRIEQLAGGLEVGVLRLSAWFPTVVPAVTRAIDDLRTADALVVDLRGNPGGLGGLVMGIGGHFLDEAVSLGSMKTRDTTLRFVVNPQLVGPDGRRVEPYGGPLVILTDPLTGSTSEIFAGGLQALERATIVGEPTAGQALPALVVGLPNGDRLMHAVADFTLPDGARLEGAGVTPDVPVVVDRQTLLGDPDPVLTEAFRWILR